MLWQASTERAMLHRTNYRSNVHLKVRLRGLHSFPSCECNNQTVKAAASMTVRACVRVCLRECVRASPMCLASLTQFKQYRTENYIYSTRETYFRNRCELYGRYDFYFGSQTKSRIRPTALRGWSDCDCM